MRPTSLWFCIVTAAMLFFVACDKQDLDEAKESASHAKENAAAASEAAQEGLEKIKEGAEPLVDNAKSLIAEPAGPDARQISAGTGTYLKARAAAAKGGIEEAIVSGPPLLVVAVDAAKVLNDAVDDETVYEPIYQQLDDEEAQERADQAIGDMPKTEVVDGLQVGFRDLHSTDTGKKLDERGVLVIWRRDDKLIGFVYRSKREIDFDKIVSEAPRLIRAFDAALQ